MTHFWRINWRVLIKNVSNWLSSAPYLREASRFWLEFEVWKTEFGMLNIYFVQNFREWIEELSKEGIKLKVLLNHSDFVRSIWHHLVPKMGHQFVPKNEASILSQNNETWIMSSEKWERTFVPDINLTLVGSIHWGVWLLPWKVM